MLLKQLKSEQDILPFETSIGEMLISRVEKFAEKLAIQEKTDNGYIKVTWKEIYQKVEQLGLGLISLGLEKGDKIAVLSRDCNEILALELACMSIGCIYVPIFQGYYPKQIEYIVSHSDPKFVVVSDETQLEKILSTMATGRIEKYFILDYSDKFIESTCIFDFKVLYKKNNAFEDFFSRISQVLPIDVCLLIYTSGGATGIAKGVPLTHHNILGQQKGLSQIWDIHQEDIILSYFPWHQSLGVIEKFAALYACACLTIERTPGIHTETLIKFLRECKPTIYFGSAQIFNELINEMKNNKSLEEAFFHDKVRFAFASSGLSQQVINFASQKKTPFFQGWGLTETTHYVTINTKNNWLKNTSGVPIPGVGIRLEGSETEICVKGISVMEGYYKDEERTLQNLTPDGWFKTGDSGIITDDGLTILGRIDSIFYLENNQKVYASKIEQTAENSSVFIAYCVAFGDDKPFTGALLFPYNVALNKWYLGKNGYTLPLADMLDEPEVIDLYRDDLRKINDSLGPENHIKYFTLIENELTVKNGELTSAMTVVRKQVTENYQEIIEAFYLKEKNIHTGRIIEV